MKNHQRGFLVPALIAFLALIAVGGGSYFYFQQERKLDTGTNTKSASETVGVSNTSNQPGTQKNATTSASSTARSAITSNVTPQVVPTKITFPTKNATFSPDQTMTVTWKGAVVAPQYSLYLIGGSVPGGAAGQLLIGKVSSADGKYDVKVPYMETNGNYRIELVVDEQNYKIIATSDPFIILKPVADGSMWILSPNGGEQYARGSTVTIQWNHQLSLLGKSVDREIRLVDKDGRIIKSTLDSTNNLTLDAGAGAQWKWTIPQTVLPGQYKIMIVEVESFNRQNGSSDMSNAAFTIY